ncbi:GNAT family N-acetyltransferase [Desulfolutivibrio sulfoxidireducens]|uniref:GNAT family N-acetyltransferase n=1 Tax=Desulfolutivibrio sulfoxidireducens TaxID=2773299 RepID=UPI00159D1DA2|nr:GNAT family N-acetyltransferase [Desulfolutivibrio sulfoxidireducens]QLA20957.1 GNAT family N-acetyltransferase [Desulfolutivibrio sulfoxidireducens]
MIRTPSPLAAEHDVVSFQSGEPVLDDWLRRRALANQASGASRTYVIADEKRVIGYYALAAGAVTATDAPGKVRRNMPDPIPVMVLGRLAVDRDWQGRGLGFDLLRDAVLRTLRAAEIAGIRALLVHALHERAGAFYEHAGFRRSPVRPLTYVLTLADAQKALAFRG